MRIEKFRVTSHEAEERDYGQSEHGNRDGEILALPPFSEPGLEFGEGDIGVAAHDPKLVHVFFRMKRVADQWIEGDWCGAKIDDKRAAETEEEQQDGKLVDAARAHGAAPCPRPVR